MNIIEAKKEEILIIGRQGENARTQVEFDISDLLEEFPNGIVSLVNLRPQDEEPYMATEFETDLGRGVATWTVMDYDLVQRGKGACQLIYADQNGVVCKTKAWPTEIKIGLQTTEEEPPEMSIWVERLLQAAAAVAPLVDEVKQIAEDLDDSIKTAEAWATGKRDGIDVEETDPTYHNNAKYYAEKTEQDYTEVKNDVSSLKSAFALFQENIPGTVQTIAFDSAGNIQSVTHKENNLVVRTDVFTFAASTITEVRTLASGESLTIVTNTDTLETTTTYAEA